MGRIKQACAWFATNDGPIPPRHYDAMQNSDALGFDEDNGWHYLNDRGKLIMQAHGWREESSNVWVQKGRGSHAPSSHRTEVTSEQG